MADSEIGTADERLAPLLQAIGQAVLGACVLENVLLVDIAQRRAASEDLTEKIAEELRGLERAPAGVLLRTLREIGMSQDVADRIHNFIQRRNQLVHYFMEDPEIARAVSSGGQDIDKIDRIDDLSIECQRLLSEITFQAFYGAQRGIGITLDDLLQGAQGVDLASATSEDERELLRLAQRSTRSSSGRSFRQSNSRRVARGRVAGQERSCCG